jgi:hypothetical protein
VTPQVKTTTTTWDSPNQRWVDTAKSVQAVSGSSSGSTLVVELPPEEAVKQVVVREVQLVNSPSEPTLLIAGRDSSVTASSGSLTICRLVIRKVDIEELVVENVQASRVTVVDFASGAGSMSPLTP